MLKLIKRISVFAVCLIVVMGLSFNITHSYVSAKTTSSKVQTNKSVKNRVALINEYQKKYFEIIKRNNVLLGCDDEELASKDMKELEDLFAEVEGQITNKTYLNKYKKIQKKYAECDGDTTIDINAFAEKNYNEIDKLLNTVYKKAKSKAVSGDLSKLYSSQSKWSKEVKNYKKVYNSKKFGTIGTSTYYSYMTNMEEFRTLLLMLYL